MVPRDPLGLIVTFEETTPQTGPSRSPAQESAWLGLLWMDGPIAADIYSVYRQIGDTAYERINPELVRRGPVFEVPYAARGLAYADYDFDVESTERYTYYVVASNSRGAESGPSETITMVPADIDPAAPITGLYPNEPYLAPLNPTFTWDPVSGADSYCVVLIEETQYGGVPVWIYRTKAPPVTIESSEGLTYADDVGASLTDGAYFQWAVFAVNANNVSFASSLEDFSTAPLVAVVRDTMQAPGEGSAVWDQVDYEGTQVPPGDYEVYFITATYDTTLDFRIVEGGGVSFAGASDPAQTQQETSVWLDSDTYDVGDPIEVHYFLPSRVRVTIVILAK